MGLDSLKESFMTREHDAGHHLPDPPVSKLSKRNPNDPHTKYPIHQKENVSRTKTADRRVGLIPASVTTSVVVASGDYVFQVSVMDLHT